MIDRVGVLGDLYQLVDACMVCGSLVEGIGGHNLIEPALAGKPILTGIHTADQQAAATGSSRRKVLCGWIPRSRLPISCRRSSPSRNTPGNSPPTPAHSSIHNAARWIEHCKPWSPGWRNLDNQANQARNQPLRRKATGPGCPADPYPRSGPSSNWLARSRSSGEIVPAARLNPRRSRISWWRACE